MSRGHAHPASLPRIWRRSSSAPGAATCSGCWAWRASSRSSDAGRRPGRSAPAGRRWHRLVLRFRRRGHRRKLRQHPRGDRRSLPGDGSNGPNALALSGIVRSDIRASLGASSAVATGVPLTITLTLVDPVSSCAPVVGAAVYLWHCDALGRYSLYSSGVTAESWLRGVQATDAAGQVRRTTIFPGCYSGRWPHVHFGIPLARLRHREREQACDLPARPPPGDRLRGLRDQRLHRERSESRDGEPRDRPRLRRWHDAGDADGHRERQLRLRGGAHRGRRPLTGHHAWGSDSAFRASSGLIGSRPTSRAIRTAFSTSGPLPFAISVPGGVQVEVVLEPHPDVAPQRQRRADQPPLRSGRCR